jgi:hypothetical protein
MRACPCCLQTLSDGWLSRGGVRLAGSCEVCGEQVCGSCLSTQVLRAGTFRQRRIHPGSEAHRTRGRVCRGCLWGLVAEKGLTPPFPQPPGHRLRAERQAAHDTVRQACSHRHLEPAMKFCPDCGEDVPRRPEHGNPSCEACGAPSHRSFNHCWGCGESFEENHPARTSARGYLLDYACDAAGCGGGVAWLMSYCPWCGEEQAWQHSEEGEDVECAACETALDRAWAYCVYCGEQAPLPEDCSTCGEQLEEESGRCEGCRCVACPDCLGRYEALPHQDATQAGAARLPQLLCLLCAEGRTRAAPEPVAAEAAAQPEPAADDEPQDDEPQDDEPQDDEPQDDEPQDDEPQDDEPQDDEEPALPQPEEPSAWAVLGVAPGTPLPQVRSAYLQLISQYHPDKVAQLGPKLQAVALEETRRLNEAWETVRRASR